MRLYDAYPLARETRADVTLRCRAFRGWTVTIAPDPAVDPVYTYKGQIVSVKAPLHTATLLELEAARKVSIMLQSEDWEIAPPPEQQAG